MQHLSVRGNLHFSCFDCNAELLDGWAFKKSWIVKIILFLMTCICIWLTTSFFSFFSYYWTFYCEWHLFVYFSSYIVQLCPYQWMIRLTEKHYLEVTLVQNDLASSDGSQGHLARFVFSLPVTLMYCWYNSYYSFISFCTGCSKWILGCFRGYWQSTFWCAFYPITAFGGHKLIYNWAWRGDSSMCYSFWILFWHLPLMFLQQYYVLNFIFQKFAHTVLFERLSTFP